MSVANNLLSATQSRVCENFLCAQKNTLSNLILSCDEKTKSPLQRSLVFISIGALFFGSVIGQSRFVDLSIYGLVALLFLYLSFLYKFTWQIVLFLVWSGVNLNFGFRLSSQQYAAAILLVYGIIIFLLGRNPYPNPVFLKRVNGKSLFIWSGVLLFYGALSFALNKTLPFDGGSYTTINMPQGICFDFRPGCGSLLGDSDALHFPGR